MFVLRLENKDMKKVLAIIILLFVVLIAGCGQDKLISGKTTVQQINETKLLKVGVDTTIPLYSFRDNDGNLVGYDIDILDEVSKRLGLHIKYYFSNTDALYAGLNSKRFDIAVGHTVIMKGKNYDYSIPYKSTKTVIVRKKGIDEKINLSNLKGRSIYLPITSVYAVIANKYNLYLQQAEKYEDGIVNLENGKSEYMIFDKEVIERILVEKGIHDLEIGYTFPEEQNIGMMFRKGNDPFVKSVNNALEEMKNDGTMKKYEDKWFTK